MSKQSTAIQPQPGPQTRFLASSADLAVYGGAAGGGKSWALLLECLRHVNNPRFRAVLFRRTTPQIRNAGGLWDASTEIYPLVGAKPNLSALEWTFPSGARVKFAHLQEEADKLTWQGAEVALIGWDELTHFTESQFFYLLSRNRSTCGVRPYIRAATNPDALSWVKDFLAPWLHPDFPHPAGSGELRHFVRDAGQIEWVPAGTPDAKSVTFVRASIHDNRVLLEKDPGYLATLKALSLIDRRRLLDGDWEVVASGDFFQRDWFRYVERPEQPVAAVRYWDLAASEVKPGADPDWTAGVLMQRDSDGGVTILDVQRTRDNPAAVERLVARTLNGDRHAIGPRLAVRMEQEPGSAGVTVISHYQRSVFFAQDFQGVRVTGSKADRARPLAAIAEQGKLRLVRGLWNRAFVNECCAFPTAGVHDDQVDAASGALQQLVSRPARPVVRGRTRSAA